MDARQLSGCSSDYPKDVRYWTIVESKGWEALVLRGSPVVSGCAVDAVRYRGDTTSPRRAGRKRPRAHIRRFECCAKLALSDRLAALGLHLAKAEGCDAFISFDRDFARAANALGGIKVRAP